MKVITLSEVASRLRQRRQGRGYIGKFINECTIEDAIPLDKIKQAREEIKGKAFTEEIFDEDIFNSINTESVSRETAECESIVETEVVKLSEVLAILDKLIAESEGNNG